MTWPPQSPDLNPIEMVWDELDCRVKAKQPTSAQNPWDPWLEYNSRQLSHEADGENAKSVQSCHQS